MNFHNNPIDQEYIDETLDQLEDLSMKLDSYTSGDSTSNPKTMSSNVHSFVEALKIIRRELGPDCEKGDPTHWLMNGTNFHYNNNQHFKRFIDSINK